VLREVFRVDLIEVSVEDVDGLDCVVVSMRATEDVRAPIYISLRGLGLVERLSYLVLVLWPLECEVTPVPIVFL
jgi:hypothetical protein